MIPWKISPADRKPQEKKPGTGAGKKTDPSGKPCPEILFFQRPDLRDAEKPGT